MYKILKEGEVLGIVDEPNYITEKNGIYINAKKENAQGVAFNSIPYRFFNNAEPTQAFENLDVVMLVDSTASKEITDVDVNHAVNEADLMLTNMLEWQSYIDTLIESGYVFSNNIEDLKRKYTKGFVREDQLLLMVKKNLLTEDEYKTVTE